MEENMNTREKIRWVRDGIKRGYNWEEMLSFLEKEKVKKDIIKDIEEIYKEETEDREKMEMSYLERRALKKKIKKLDKIIKGAIILSKEIKKETFKMERKEIEALDELRKKMIISIVGDKEKNLEGLIDIFEASDEKGEEIVITKEMLNDMKLDEIIEIFEDLVEELKKNI